MMKLVECIPNFSVSRERDEAAFNALVETAQAVAGCTVLDVQSDGTHNRCVFTLVGSPEGIGEAAFRLAKRAMEVIDMTKHQGAHPRMGATDVIPFVPTMDMTVEECVELSRQVAQRIWEELEIPSFLYEESATAPGRVRECPRSCWSRNGHRISASGKSTPPPGSSPSARGCRWWPST